MTKQDLIQQLQELPEEASLDRVAAEIERARFMASVQRGLDQLDRGERIPHEEVEKEIDAWLAE
jgi:predicted transcriptional regulator